MANKVFISFRFSDGKKYKNELSDIFSSDVEVINCSESQDRSNLTEETIQKYLYSKLKNTSVTIVIITPGAVEHEKNYLGQYDDWMHDEIRYSLEDRENNRCNGLIAIYVPEVESSIISKNTCNNCSKDCNITTVHHFDNLIRYNMMNVEDQYKKNPCAGIFDSDYDSYCSLVPYEEFKKNYKEYIQKADEKRFETYKYKIKKNLNR